MLSLVLSTLALMPYGILADQSVISSIFRATHNSYSGNISGARGTIKNQLDQGIRMVEFDIWDGNYGTDKDYGIGHSSVGDQVDHTSPNPAGNLLRPWLTVVKDWSVANPNHAPLQVMLDLKSDLTDNDNFAAGNPAALNALMKDVFGDRLLWASKAPAGLPSVDALRGKIMPVMSGNGKTRSEYKSDAGSSPSVARNNKGFVVEVHDDGFDNVWYWSGKANSDGSINWLRHGKYDTGRNPAVIMNDDGWIVEVHKSQVFSTIFYRVGKLDEATCEITWTASKQYDNGVSPTIAFTGTNTLREIHQSQSNSNRWQWIGTLDTNARTVTWTGNAQTSDPFYTKSQSNGVAVYIDSAGKVVYSSGSFVGKRIAYEQVFFVEFQPSESAELQSGAIFYAADASNKDFIVSARNSGKLVRGWGLNNASLASTPLANYPSTDYPYDAWYNTLIQNNNAVL